MTQSHAKRMFKSVFVAVSFYSFDSSDSKRKNASLLPSECVCVCSFQYVNSMCVAMCAYCTIFWNDSCGWNFEETFTYSCPINPFWIESCCFLCSSCVQHSLETISVYAQQIAIQFFISSCWDLIKSLKWIQMQTCYEWQSLNRTAKVRKQFCKIANNRKRFFIVEWWI